ncbi:PLP-dependent aminotransferase family protein [Bacillus sp. B1-b2]|uniref:aminotransferase-like domain-containing protein n=1 Tax=Bacillus sp. B1-b2 TaxID=2653201 RepID=UPI00126265CF|nr:PLP-dependent aminotransferase family protein [Bacillus sp. B1-b2]KAB7671105.1 PLP-dependent aminotransferase family protein [Bacillus sp. B1-b2]
MSMLKPISFSSRFPQMDVIGTSFAGNQNHLIPLSFGFPAPESLPVDLMAPATKAAMEAQGTNSLGYTGGSGPNHVVNWIRERSQRRNLEVSNNQIVVTSGSSQGIDLVTRTLTNPGDEVWVEAPTFFGAIKTFRLAEVHLTSFPIDENGLIVDTLEHELQYRISNNLPLPKILYIIPNYHNPGGVCLSLERRKKLAELAYEYNFFILEDDAYVELSFDSHFLPSVYSFAPERVIYLSTFSKIIAPGIRLGWAIGLPEVIEKMKLLKIDGLTSVYVQEVTHQVLEKMNMDDHISSLNSIYASRKNAMVAAIREHFGNDVSFHEPTGGFFLWLTFNKDVNTSDFMDIAVQEGVSFIDGKHFFLKNEGFHYMRLCFTYCDEATIYVGIKRLANSYYQYVKSKLNLEEAQ